MISKWRSIRRSRLARIWPCPDHHRQGAAVKADEGRGRAFNGVTLCTGSLGSNPDNDIPDIIRSLKGRIHFAHVRNLQYNAPAISRRQLISPRTAAWICYAIMKALYDIGFDGIVRPDHGRAIWGEVSMPGYGLYDRALGACYLNGLWEAIEKQNRN